MKTEIGLAPTAAFPQSTAATIRWWPVKNTWCCFCCLEASFRIQGIYETFDLSIELNRSTRTRVATEQAEKTSSAKTQLCPLLTKPQSLFSHCLCRSLEHDCLGVPLLLGSRNHTIFQEFTQYTGFGGMPACTQTSFSEIESVSISRSFYQQLLYFSFGFLHGTQHKHCNWVTL